MTKNKRKVKNGVIRREPEVVRFTKVIFSFAHIWVCLILALLSAVMLYISWLLKVTDSFWSSICANVFAGLVTGLVICLIGGAKQISITRMQAKKEWLQNLAALLKIYLGDYYEMIKLRFDKYDGTREVFDFYYEMSIHASNINVEIHQSAFNKILSFNPDKYCRKQFGYDSVVMGERFDTLHDYVEMIEIDCPSSREIAKRFETVHPELRKLNASVCDAIRDLDIRLTDIRKTII